MLEIYKVIEFRIQLKHDVDYYDVILKIQQDLRKIFKYTCYENSGEYMICVIKFKIPYYNCEYGVRHEIMNLPAVKTYYENVKSNRDEDYQCEINKNSRILRHMLRNDRSEHIENGITYHLDDVKEKAKIEQEEFDRQISEIIPECDLKLRHDIIKHPLLNGNIERIYWHEYNSCE